MTEHKIQTRPLRGLRKRPLIVQLLAFALWLAPLGMTLELIYVYHVPLLQFYWVFNPLIWNWQVILACIITPLVGIAVWTMHWWGWWTFAVYSVLLLANNITLWIFDLTLSPLGLRIVMVAGLVILVMVLVRREFRAPCFNPRLRWWEQAHRFVSDKFRIHIREFGTGADLFEAISFDVSTKGCFVASDHQVRIGETYCFDITTPEGKVLHTCGEVVWIHPGSDSIPQGFGCSFKTMQPDFHPVMTQSIRRLRMNTRQNR